MTRQVNFNGAVLVRAGGATRVDASAFQNLGIAGLGIVALIGEADSGLPGQIYSFTSPQQMVQTFRSGPLADAADLAFRPMNDPRVPGGAQTVLAIKVNQSLQATLSLPGGGAGQILATSKTAGAGTNKLTTQITTSAGGKVVQNIFSDGARSITETSPPLGGVPDFQIQYVGAGTAATLTINGTQLSTVCSGAPGDNLNLTLSTYPLLSDVLAAIQQNPAYAVTALSGNPYTLPAASMDWQSAVAIKTTPVPVTTKLARVIAWINTNSQLVTFARSGTSTGLPPDDTTVAIGAGSVPSALSYSGGARGISANSNWQAALDSLNAVRVNQLVPLISSDLTNQGLGSTATFASVAAATDAHVAFTSSTAGKNECQAYLGMAGTKTQLLAQAAVLQSLHTLLTGQKVTRPNAAGTITLYDEWSLACMLAAGRAGSIQGEPLVYKTLRCNAVGQDASWNPSNDGADMILGGVTFAFSSPNQGYRFDRCITTYTKADNDAYVEESIVTGWKALAYDLRTQLETIFTGTRGTPLTVRSIYDAAANLLEKYRQQGQIVDSVASDGSVQPGYRDLSVTLNGGTCNLNVTVSPVSGVNFLLQSIFITPASIAA